MKTGRPRKPTNFKVLTGTFRKDRENPDEPTPEISIPDVPSHLSDVAKVEWGRVSQQMAACGMLTNLDRAILALYCQAYARWAKAEKKIAAMETAERPDGELMPTPQGFQVRSEWLNIANKAMEQVHKYGVELGLSAQSRSRIKVTPPQEKPSGWKAFGA